jgi:predicted Zn-dependent protease
MRTTTLAAALLVGGAAAALAGCKTNPATGERNFMLLSEEEEVEIGQQAAPEVVKELGGLYPDPDVQRYVSDIGKNIAARSARPDIPWSFQVVNAPEPNAMALPGGPIFITQGLLALFETEAELAGVLAHEVGHTAARHQAQLMSRSAAFQTIGGVAGKAGELASALILLKFSRGMEAEADALGIDYTAKAGHDPRGIPASFEKLLAAGGSSGGTPDFVQTHPDLEDRIEDTQEQIAESFSEAELASLSRSSPRFDVVIRPMELPAGARNQQAEPQSQPQGQPRPHLQPEPQPAPQPRSLPRPGSP